MYQPSMTSLYVLRRATAATPACITHRARASGPVQDECGSVSSTITACFTRLRLRTKRIGALVDEKSDRLTTKKRIGFDLILFGELHRPQSILVGRHCVFARLLGSEVWIQRSTSGRHRRYQKHSIWVSSSSDLALFLSNQCSTSSF